ncbi:MAG: DEAD/DEAH box helicase [Opitutales bacterium]|nr:DEAD/DEAH box helicase [Opitutales bacterium]
MKIIKKILSFIGIDSKNNKKRSSNSTDKSRSQKLHKRQSKQKAKNSTSAKCKLNKDCSNIKIKKRQPKKLPQPLDVSILKEQLPNFSKLGLSVQTLSAIKDMGYIQPTPIQEKSIDVILSGLDIIATAQTGTGKTAAFALPIIDKIKDCSTEISVLVLSPTRELASQTKEAFDNFSKYVDIKSLLIQGGVSVNNQITALHSGVDIVVATPGRLLDLYKQREIFLSNIKYLVLDEVDRMFDMGFIDDVSAIIRACPKNRQTLFFSATMPDAVLRLSSWALRNPKKIDIGVVHSPADTIEHYVYPVDAIQKYDLLVKLLETLSFTSLIVFTRTRIDADRITQWLENHNYNISTLHSDRTQRERDKALADFKNHKTSILVATDIASRGLDISGVECVINYNVPEHPEDYVHRIGRTGRANSEGFAITLYSPDENSFLKKIEAFINARIERRKLDSFEYRTEPQLEKPIRRPRKRNK